jgi:2-polyprenyl-6-methoxyphenol hydroxylase-like FAD-dependent oxidoreductase
MPIDCPVVIAGAGPVGLALAADLAWRGVRSLVIEPQNEVHPHPRAISIGVRTMEHYRRLGLDALTIDAGVPRSRALDVIYTTRLLQKEIFRFRIPSIDELGAQRERLAQEIPETAASPYYKTWTAQSPLERALRERLAQNEAIQFRFGRRVTGFEEGRDHVLVNLEDENGCRQSVTASYLIGCDGAASVVRAGLGIRLEGRGTLGQALGIYFRAAGLEARLAADGARPGVMYWVLVRGCGGVIYTIDGGDEWVYNRYFAAGEPIDTGDPAAAVRNALGGDLDVEVLSVQNWLPRQLVAERYGSRRVFLAGDACHLFVPTGGFGMNTGVGDAVDLAWKIAAREAGWGGERLLASYEAERRPVGLFNTLEAADNYDRSSDLFNVPDDFERDGPEGESVRAAIAVRLPPKIKHFAPIGVHLGYRYEGSPLIVPDGTPAPPMETATYTPTARPGHRAPHAWLSRDRSMLDLYGRGFVLLCFGAGSSDADGFITAARAARIPIESVPIDDVDIARVYERRLVLVRPDGHVAWRGDVPPADASEVLKIATGR